jgi:flagellar basal-body rod modification protein FlgD
MTTIDTNSSIYDSLGLTQNTQNSVGASNELGQDAFMRLMLAQMQNQDPLSPMENGQFIAQLAQFQSVSGINDLSNSFSDFVTSMQSNQALQASALVGRQVLVDSNTAALGNSGSVTGAAVLPASTTNMSVYIYDSSGQLVRTINMGEQSAGEIEFNWDGKADDGSRLPAGQYDFKAEAAYDGENYELATAIYSTVESVVLGGGNGITLNVTGQGEVPMSVVSKIM